jgi:hypothetical protein
MHRFILLLLLLSFSCATKDTYEPSVYYDAKNKDSLLTSIITHVYTAPPYTSMEDRFKPEHRDFYSQLTHKFSIHKLYIDEKGKHYFLLLRPGPKSDEQRGVGGYFFVNANFRLTGFREIFVTPLLHEAEVKDKGLFLFDKMVKNEISEYLKMKSYVQWPNEVSRYDTTTYEWKLDTLAN